MTRIYSALVITLMTFFAYSCCAAEKHIPNVPYYYGTWSGYSMPVKPSHLISKEDAIGSNSSYYIAYYDEKDRLKRFEKYLKNELRDTVIYYYRESGSVERSEFIDKDGAIKENRYDEKGKLMK